LLERALAARGPGARAHAASTRRPAPRRRRAAAGANREAILTVVRERPGVSVGEVQAATGIARSSVSVVLTRLVGEGVLRRERLPGGGVGFTEATVGRPAEGWGTARRWSQRARRQGPLALRPTERGRCDAGQLPCRRSPPHRSRAREPVPNGQNPYARLSCRRPVCGSCPPARDPCILGIAPGREAAWPTRPGDRVGPAVAVMT
jgi:DNA-binding transcriptional ArsR family regulator